MQFKDEKTLCVKDASSFKESFAFVLSLTLVTLCKGTYSHLHFIMLSQMLLAQYKYLISSLFLRTIHSTRQLIQLLSCYFKHFNIKSLSFGILLFSVIASVYIFQQLYISCNFRLRLTFPLYILVFTIKSFTFLSYNFCDLDLCI